MLGHRALDTNTKYRINGEKDKEMLSAIKKKLKDSSQLKEAEDEATTIESVSRTELFALPGSEKWKGAAKIREAWPVRKS